MPPARFKARLTRTLHAALKASGCPRPAETAQLLLEFTNSNNNPTLHGNKHDPTRYRIAPSTYSSRVSQIDLETYQESINQGLHDLATRALQAYPPDQSIDLILDPHEEPYNPTHHPSLIPEPARRQTYAFQATANNKHAPSCHRILTYLLTWTTQGQRIRLPLAFRLLQGGDLFKGQQVEWILQRLGRLKRRIRFLLADREYDARDVRHVCKKHEMPLGFRIRCDGRNRDRRVTLPDGTTRSHGEILAGMARNPVQIETYKARIHETIAVTTRRVRARLDPDSPLMDITYMAGLESDRSQGTPRWRLSRLGTIAIAFPVGTRSDVARRAYRSRWAVEDYFRDLTTDPPKPRAKTIKSFLVSYYAYAVRIALALMGQLHLRLQLASSCSRTDLARITVKSCNRLLANG